MKKKDQKAYLTHVLESTDTTMDYAGQVGSFDIFLTWRI